MRINYPQNKVFFADSKNNHGRRTNKHNGVISEGAAVMDRHPEE